MSEYTATVTWQRNGAVFTDNRYSRHHLLEFDGGTKVEGSSSPHVVPLPYSVEAAVDPEEAFVSALSSCHMLCFLYVAAKRGFLVESYRDVAIGVLGTHRSGKAGVTQVTLRPRVEFGGERRPTADEAEAMHHAAHEECYIASSVLTEVRCEPVD